MGWTQKQIDNPDYKGEWVHPMVANPAYKDDDTVYHRCNPCTAIGFELWQVKSGSLFDDIITDSIEEAKAFYDETHGVKAPAEEAAQKKLDEEEAAKKAAEEAAKEKEEEEWEEGEEEEEEEEKKDL